MVSVDKKLMVWLPVDNNYCSSCISYEINVMWSIIKIIYCNTPIDDVDSNIPYVDIFL